jgi:hypothetical protein
MVSRIFFIIGVAGAGKTTLVKNIKGKFIDCCVHDFDELGVPKYADEKWRKEATNYWLSKTKECLIEGKTMILCGFFVPSKLEQQSNFDSNMKIKYGFIKINNETIKKRLLQEIKWLSNWLSYRLF